jgi:hypothetical protein
VEKIKIKVNKMKNKVLTTITILCILALIDVQAQPYIFYNATYSDTIIGELTKINRFDIRTSTDEEFLFPEEYSTSIVDQLQSYLMIAIRNWGYFLYDCADTSNYIELNNFWGVQVNEILSAPQRNTLYIFSDDYSKISEFNTLNSTITSELNLGKTAYYNTLMEPKRSTFFSSDKESIYFFNIDSTGADQVWTYSLETNQITDRRNLLDLGGYSGSFGYSLTFGKNGKGIIESYPVYYNNPDRDYYFRFYDFDTNERSDFIHHNGEAEAYFTGNGEFTIIMEAYLDTLNDSLGYYHTGDIEIYKTETAELIKSLNVPSNGIIYTFDNYPNDIYYVVNLETEPEIYNLTKLKLNVMTPGIALSSGGLKKIETVTITINGEFFTDSSVIYFNGVPRNTTFVSDSVITFSISAGTSVGNYPVWVNNYGSVSDTLIYSVVDSLPQLITPILECVRDNGNNTFTAFFGYNNYNNCSVFIPISNKNTFSPNPADRGQTKIFLQGRQVNAFSINFDGDNLSWILNAQAITANKRSTQCP